MKGFETPKLSRRVAGPCKKECPAMKGFETRKKANRHNTTSTSKKECPAMKGFETISNPRKKPHNRGKKECPAMKGFETGD